MKQFIICLFICLPFLASGQWQLNHTFPSAPVEIEVVNDRIYVLTSINGLYSSDDNGQSWQRNMSIPDSILHDLYADEDVLMAANGAGVLLSFDDGANWTLSNNGMSNPGVFSVTRSGDNLLCGSFATFMGGLGIIYVSTDNGNSWTEEVNNSGSAGFPEFVAKGNIVLVSSYSSLLYYSDDYGASFNTVNIPFGTEDMNFTNSTVVAATSDGSIPRIMYSLDNGQNWQLGIDTVAATDFDNAGDTVYASAWLGFYYSTNGGISWTQYNDGIPSLPRCHAVGAKGSDIWLGHQAGGLYKMTFPVASAITEQTMNNLLAIYPNPADDEISIALPGSNRSYSIEIYNEAGQVVFSTISDNATISISTKELSAGLYFVRCSDAEKTITGKFLKQ